MLEDHHFQDQRDMITAMEVDMIRLRERYKHDSSKQYNIAQDWMDYSSSVFKVKLAKEFLNVDMDYNAYDNYYEKTKEAYIRIDEVFKRVEKELENDSVSKIVHERLKKKAGEIDKIFENENKNENFNDEL